MKNKIALLTLPLGHNYGGIIQNYALQKVLAKMGHDVVTIDRIADNPHSKIKILANKYKTYFFRYFLQSKNPKYLDYSKVFEHNLRFLKEHVNLSPAVKTTGSLADYFKKEKFNLVIVGSDQVWRPKYSPDIFFNFYLDFLQKETSIKKVAYAASFGTETWEYTEEQTKASSELIQQFNAVAVREDSGVKLSGDYLNRKDAIQVLDPTLLLEAEDYSKLIGQKEKRNGLFTYVLDDSMGKKDFILNCSKHLNLEVYTNQAKYNTDTFKSNKVEDYLMPPLEGWLQGFRDANFVITDSFHGTLFSIINQKPFLSLVNLDRGASRFESILKQLGLEDRLVYNVEKFDKSKLEEEIDYVAVKLKLNRLKDDSLNFIKNNI
ncbi:MAG: polysaccharide pyruvyl transferase family protein [Bacteroidota bacterium]